MIRKTSLDAYNKIKENGLLAKRAFELYALVFEQGPMTCRQAVKILAARHGNSAAITFSSFGSRFADLRRKGVFAEMGTIVDPDTGNEVILWDVTERLPVRPNKVDLLCDAIDNLDKRRTKLLADLERALA